MTELKTNKQLGRYAKMCLAVRLRHFLREIASKLDTRETRPAWLLGYHSLPFQLHIDTPPLMGKENTWGG